MSSPHTVNFNFAVSYNKKKKVRQPIWDQDCFEHIKTKEVQFSVCIQKMSGFYLLIFEIQYTLEIYFHVVQQNKYFKYDDKIKEIDQQ